MNRLRAKIFLLSVLALIFFGALTLNVTSALAQWPMFLGSAAHHVNIKEPIAVSLKLKWKFDTAGAVYSSPVVSDNMVFVASYDKKIYALSESDGKLLWSYQAGGEIFSTPAIDNGVVYFGSKDGFVYALKADTGALVWKYDGESGFVSSPVVADGLVLIGSSDSYLYAIDASTGKKSWRFKLDDYARFGGIYSSPAVSESVVYSAGKNGLVSSNDTKNGALNWQFKALSAIYASPVIKDGILYIPSYDRVVYAVDLKEGKILWKRALKEASAHASVAVTSDRVYVSLRSGVIKALNRANGSVSGEYKVPAEVKSTPVAYQSGQGGVLLVGALNGGVYTIDLKSKEVRLGYSTKGAIHASPAVSGARVYIGSEDGSLYALE